MRADKHCEVHSLTNLAVSEHETLVGTLTHLAIKEHTINSIH